MAEALAVMGALATVAELSKQAASIVDLIKQVRKAPVTAQKEREQIEQLVQLADKISKNPAFQVKSVECAVKICLEQLQQLQTIFRNAESNVADKTVKKVQKALYMTLKSSEVEALFIQLERSKTSLAITMHEIDSLALYNLDGAMKDIALMINGLDGKMDNLSLIQKDAQRRSINEEHWRKIQNTLWFPEMNQRLEQISLTHNKTFQWIFEPELKSENTWDSFTTWMTSEQDIYWIAGKPGSGKSTLMKSISQSARTREIVSVDKISQDSRFCSFFFWNAGSRLQKTLEGALRSLLFQALGHDLSLAPVILKSKSDLDHIFLRAQDECSISWSEEKLIASLIKVLTEPSNAVYFLFLDGLDECQGNSLQIIDVIIKISRLERVKICLSSRSWSIFESRLNIYPHLHLEQLTKKDIESYVFERLRSDELTRPFLSEWRYVSTGTGAGWETLADSIIRRAEGVFLWVQLVIQDLCEAAWKRETISELGKRLDDLPEELEELMKTILQSKIDKRHRAETKQIFQIMMEFEDISLPVLALALDSGLQRAKASEILSMPAAFVLDCCNSLEERIQRRTGGFLDVRTAYSWGSTLFDALYDRSITFMHRSAFDLIKDLQAIPGWGSFDKHSQEHTQNAIFKSHVANFAARTLERRNRSGPCMHLRRHNFVQIIHPASLLSEFSELHRELFDGSLKLLQGGATTAQDMPTANEYALLISLFFYDTDKLQSSSILPISTVIQDSLGFATHVGLYQYALCELEDANIKKDETATYLLFVVMERIFYITCGLLNPRHRFSCTDQLLPDFLRQLLRHGADANAPMTVSSYDYNDETARMESKMTRKATTYDLLLICFARYYYRVPETYAPLTSSILFQILDHLVKVPLELGQTTVQRVLRFRLLLIDMYMVVSVNAEISIGLLLRQCYKKLGYATAALDLIVKEEHFRVVGLSCELYADDVFQPVERVLFCASDTNTLSSEESESFIPFHDILLYNHIGEDLIQTSARKELEDHILTILDSRNDNIHSAIDKEYAPFKQEERLKRMQQRRIQYWGDEYWPLPHNIELPL